MAVCSILVALALLEQATEIEQLFRKKMAQFASTPAVRLAITSCRRSLPTIDEIFSVAAGYERRQQPGDVINAVADFRVDIGLIEGHTAEIIAEPWLEDELVVFAPPDSPLLQEDVTLARLAAAPWILRERGSGTRELSITCCCLICLNFISAWAWQLRGYQTCMRHGLGISCLSRRVIAEQLEAGSLVEVPVPLPRLVRTLWRIHHRQKHLSSALNRFCVIANMI
jgi:DNA-binding transcriptional LysR family regulator